MPKIKSSLVKPYFFIDWDDDTRFRIDARARDIERFQSEYKKWSEAIKGLSEQQSDASICHDAFLFLCGDETGEKIYQLCMDDLLADDPDLKDEDCVYQLVPVLTMIAEQWVDHIASMDIEHSARAQSYIKKLAKRNAL